jgi:TPR repeat protein
MKSFLTSVAKTLGLSRAQKSFASIIAAAEQGNIEAQCIIAGCYKYGDGVEENHTEAARWFRIAAENGNTLAQRSLGFCYARGEGVETDYAEAGKWYRMAAEQGDQDAKSTLNDSISYFSHVPVQANHRFSVTDYYRLAVIGRQAGEFLLADRTERRGGVGLGLRAALDSLTKQSLDVLSGLDFEMAEVLIAGEREVLERLFQRAGRTRRQDTQRLGG